MTNPSDALAGLEAVLGLAEKATAGEWEAVSRGSYFSGEEGSVYGAEGENIVGAELVEPFRDAETIRGEIWFADAALIAAAVNYLRQHGPALRAGLVEVEGLRADAEAWRKMQIVAEVFGADDADKPILIACGQMICLQAGDVNATTCKLSFKALRAGDKHLGDWTVTAKRTKAPAIDALLAGRGEGE